MVMKCVHCNSEVADGMQFCPYCGSPMVSQQPQQDQYQQPQTGMVLKLVEYFFYLLAAADFLLGTFGVLDITGWRWSPVLFGAIGAIIGQYVKQKYGIVDDEED